MTQEQLEQVLVPKYTQAIGFAVNVLNTITKLQDEELEQQEEAEGKRREESKRSAV